MFYIGSKYVESYYAVEQLFNMSIALRCLCGISAFAVGNQFYNCYAVEVLWPLETLFPLFWIYMDCLSEFQNDNMRRLDFSLF